MNKTFSEIIGWVGMSLVLIAFALLNFNIITKDDVTYILFNIIGSAGIAYISLKKKTYQPAVLNILWALIALYGLFALIF